MLNNNINLKVGRVYKNCLDNMQDTPDDWQKAHDAFYRVYEKSGGAHDIRRDIQVCYLGLEQHFGHFRRVV